MKPIISLLREFNFTEAEAKVYIALLENGASSGYEASKFSGVARSKVYNVLESLLQRGAVISAQGEKNPLYQAISIEQLCEVIRSRMNNNIEKLTNEANHIEESEFDERIWHIYERETAVATGIRMINSAKDCVYAQVWLDNLDKGIEKSLSEKEQALEKALIVVYDADERYNTTIKHFYKHGFEPNKLEEMGGSWLLLTTDNHEMLYISFRGSHLIDACYTRNPSMVMLAREYVIHDVYSLRLIERMGDMATSEFGENMEGIRDVYFPK